MEMFDKTQNQFVPTMTGLGTHVEVRDSDDKMIMSRVRYAVHGHLTPEFRVYRDLYQMGPMHNIINY